MGRFPSGQRGQTVNLLAKPSEVRILPSPLLWCGRCSLDRAGIAQLVEHQPSKLRVAGSSPVSRSWCGVYLRAHVAQAVEHFLGKEEVVGSSPIVGSILTRSYGFVVTTTYRCTLLQYF